MTVQIYHNPRCTKSRQTLALLEEKKINPEIKLYLQETLKKSEIKDLLKKLDLTPRQILRTNEAEYKDNDLKNKDLSDDDLIAAIAKYPKILQRPIVVNGNKAALGRPPENVLEII